MDNHVTVVLVIPVFNFEYGILESMKRLQRWQNSIVHLNTSIIFSDDGSADSTADMITEFSDEFGTGWRLLRSIENRGKGFAVRTGIKAAYEFQPDLIIFSDCDLHYGLNIIQDRMVPVLDSVDLAIVDRTFSGQSTKYQLPRRFASAVFNRIVAVLTGITFKDTQGGLKGFRAKQCKPLFEALTLDSFAFDVELLSVAQYNRFTIGRVPVKFEGAKEDHMSTVSLFSTPLLMLIDIFKININWKTGRYLTSGLQQRLETDIYAIHD